MPIRVENNEYAREVADRLREAGVRIEVDYADKNMNEKIKTYKKYKDPYILVLGAKEAETKTVSLNIRGLKEQVHDLPLDRFVEMCRQMNREHSLELMKA